MTATRGPIGAVAQPATKTAAPSNPAPSLSFFMFTSTIINGNGHSDGAAPVLPADRLCTLVCEPTSSLRT
jgi:hypothetical protein